MQHKQVFNSASFLQELMRDFQSNTGAWIMLCDRADQTVTHNDPCRALHLYNQDFVQNFAIKSTNKWIVNKIINTLLESKVSLTYLLA